VFNLIHAMKFQAARVLLKIRTTFRFVEIQGGIYRLPFNFNANSIQFLLKT